MVQRLYRLRIPDVLCLGRLDRLLRRAAQFLRNQFWEDDHTVFDKCAASCQRHNKRVSHLDLLVLHFKLSKLRNMDICIIRVDLNGPLVFSNGLIIVDHPQIVMGISREKITNTNDGNSK